jgi:predicted RNA-binding Zn ribbon-like protein
MEPGDRAAAPGPLRLVQAFVNTVDREDGPDLLADPAGLGRWLAGAGIASPGLHVTEAELGYAVALREALRDLLAVHNALPADADAARATVEAAGARAALALVLDGGEQPKLRPSAPGTDGALGAIVASVHAAMVEGSWGRLKACERGHCRWAFYDASRNRSSRWCSMAVCGAREKSRRAYWRARNADVS